METIEIDGKTCVVVHISESSFRRGYSVCTGQKFDIPDQNDKRPKTLCEKCRLEFVNPKGR